MDEVPKQAPCNGVKTDNNYQPYQMKFCSPKRKRATGPPSSKKTSMLAQEASTIHLSFDLKPRNPCDEPPCYEDPLDCKAQIGRNLLNSKTRSRQGFPSINRYNEEGSTGKLPLHNLTLSSFDF